MMPRVGVQGSTGYQTEAAKCDCPTSSPLACTDTKALRGAHAAFTKLGVTVPLPLLIEHVNRSLPKYNTLAHALT